MKTFLEAADIDFKDEKTVITLSKDLGKFPPTCISTCGTDPLRDDGRVLEKMLKKEGLKTKSDRYEGLPHIPGGEKFLANVVKGGSGALSQEVRRFKARNEPHVRSTHDG